MTNILFQYGLIVMEFLVESLFSHLILFWGCIYETYFGWTGRDFGADVMEADFSAMEWQVKRKFQFVFYSSTFRIDWDILVETNLLYVFNGLNPIG